MNELATLVEPMALLAATVVEWGSLGKTVLASLVIGIGVTVAFSVAILGMAQFSELRRSGRTVAATGSAILAVTALTFCTVAIVLGLIVMMR